MASPRIEGESVKVEIQTIKPKTLKTTIANVLCRKLGEEVTPDDAFVQKCVGIIEKSPRFQEMTVGEDLETVVDEVLYCVDNTEIELLDTEGMTEMETITYSMLCFLAQKDSKPIMNKKMIKTLFLKRDPEFFKTACGLTQRVFDKLWEQMQNNDDPAFRKKCKVFIGNIISILPFLNPENIESGEMTIPQKINGKWEFVKFKIGRTPLRPQSAFGSTMAKMFGESIDILELEPMTHIKEGARAIRSFQGTTFLTGKGHVQTLLADLFPFSSVGDMLLYFTKGAIKSSFEKAKTDKVDLYGQSLGGSTALLAALAFPNKVAKVRTYGAPKLYGWSMKRHLKKLKKQGKDFEPKIRCYLNENDSVPNVGTTVPPGTKVIKLIGVTKHGKFAAHAKALSGQKKVVMVKLGDKQFKGWSALAVIHMILAPLLFTVIATFFLIVQFFKTLFYRLPKAAINKIFRRKKLKPNLLPV